MAITCLITAYKEDFYEPPCYAILHYLLENVNNRDIQNQCQNLLDRFLNEGENIFESDSSNLFFFV